MSTYSETVDIARQLIRFDTSNYNRDGDDVETDAARYVMDLFDEVGVSAEWIEPIKGRPSVVTRIPGQDRSRPGLMLHGHLDVVPAIADDWSVDPFGAQVIDGMLYGRGAVDMKNMDAMIISLVRDMAREGWVPPRDIVIAMLADEEAGGKKGAHWLVDNRPELFEGVSHAVSEVGGYNTYVNGKRVYLLQTAEKGLSWYRLIAEGKAGHGSQVNHDNAVTYLAGALADIGRHDWQLEITDTVRQLLQGVADLTGLPFDEEDPHTVDALIDALGPAKTFVGATTRTTANPTQLNGGYAVNVIPGRAVGGLDVRPIPGTESDVHDTLCTMAPNVRFEAIHADVGMEVPFEGPEVEAMAAALKAEDPDSEVLPYMLSGGTDNKAFSRLGIQGYGFAPVQLPEGFDFPAKFHGVDECVPVDSIDFGLRVLTRFVQSS